MQCKNCVEIYCKWCVMTVLYVFSPSARVLDFAIFVGEKWYTMSIIIVRDLFFCIALFFCNRRFIPLLMKKVFKVLLSLRMHTYW
jgi:hypothetical protein